MRRTARAPRATSRPRKPKAHWLELADAFAPLAFVVVCTLWAAVQLYSVSATPVVPQGDEVDHVAQMIAQDRGFSLRHDDHPLYLAGSGVIETAWVDPVYAYALAGMYTSFGERAPQVALSLNVGAAVACFMLLFQVVQRFGGAFVAAASVALLAMHPWFRTITLELGAATWSAFFVTLTALLLMRALEKPTVWRTLLLGTCTGVTALACSSTLLFIPVIAVLMLAVTRARLSRRIVIATTMLLVACGTVVPWTARNLSVFGEIVPVRTGVGQLAHLGTVMLGSTIAPDSVDLPVHPGWYASTPRAAVRNAATLRGRNALESAQREYYRLSPPPGFEQMNEAQRDRALLEMALDYTSRHPMLVAVMGLFKLELFARRMGGVGTWLLVAAYVSMLMLYRERKVLALGLLVFAYALPHAFLVAHFARDRVPIEPLVVAVAAVGAARLGAWAMSRRTATYDSRRWSAPAVGPAARMRRTTAAR